MAPSYFCVIKWIFFSFCFHSANIRVLRNCFTLCYQLCHNNFATERYANMITLPLNDVLTCWLAYTYFCISRYLAYLHLVIHKGFDRNRTCFLMFQSKMKMHRPINKGGKITVMCGDTHVTMTGLQRADMIVLKRLPLVIQFLVHCCC